MTMTRTTKKATTKDVRDGSTTPSHPRVYKTPRVLLTSLSTLSLASRSSSSCFLRSSMAAAEQLVQVYRLMQLLFSLSNSSLKKHFNAAKPRIRSPVVFLKLGL